MAANEGRKQSTRRVIRPEDLDRAELERYGKILDRRPVSLSGETVAEALSRALLRVRGRDGKLTPLVANAAQRAFERRREEHNIVLKARQMGMTSWVAARFFLKTMTQPGTLTLEVAHTQEAAEEIFRIVHRFWRELPEELRKGPLKTSRANVRQLAFPALDAQYMVMSAGDRNAGRGLTVQNLHGSELARWPGEAAETLAGLRAALAPGAEVILESTPDGVGGCFYEEWQKAAAMGVVRHFLPWWLEPRYRARAVEEESLTEEERGLRAKQGLTLEQIGYRRQMRASLRGLARQEFAEDEESCFRASGESFFDLDRVETRLRAAPEPMATRANGELQVWLPAVAGRRYLVAADPAGGGSEGDFSAVEVLDVETAMQCAEFAGHRGVGALAALVRELAAEYNGAWIVVERNNHGSGVLAHLEQAGAERVFAQNGQPGWLTNMVTRPVALARLETLLAERPDCVMSRRLLGECRSFVRLANGRTGARAGAHDDRVMAMAIGLGAREEILRLGGR
jgi:hypothetical protein